MSIPSLFVVFWKNPFIKLSSQTMISEFNIDIRNPILLNRAYQSGFGKELFTYVQIYEALL